MFRRPPTRIELKMDDVKEFDDAKAEREAPAATNSLEPTPGPSKIPDSQKVDITELIQQRIGYRAQPIPQVNHLPNSQ
jgi:hypothetical protein